MTIDEVTNPDPLKSELERNKKAAQALKVKRMTIKAQQAQQQLRAAKAPAAPLS